MGETSERENVALSKKEAALLAWLRRSGQSLIKVGGTTKPLVACIEERQAEASQQGDASTVHIVLPKKMPRSRPVKEEEGAEAEVEETSLSLVEVQEAVSKWRELSWLRRKWIGLWDISHYERMEAQKRIVRYFEINDYVSALLRHRGSDMPHPYSEEADQERSVQSPKQQTRAVPEDFKQSTRTLPLWKRVWFSLTGQPQEVWVVAYEKREEYLFWQVSNLLKMNKDHWRNILLEELCVYYRKNKGTPTNQMSAATAFTSWKEQGGMKSWRQYVDQEVAKEIKRFGFHNQQNSKVSLKILSDNVQKILESELEERLVEKEQQARLAQSLVKKTIISSGVRLPFGRLAHGRGKRVKIYTGIGEKVYRDPERLFADYGDYAEAIACRRPIRDEADKKGQKFLAYWLEKLHVLENFEASCVGKLKELTRKMQDEEAGSNEFEWKKQYEEFLAWYELAKGELKSLNHAMNQLLHTDKVNQCAELVRSIRTKELFPTWQKHYAVHVGFMEDVLINGREQGVGKELCAYFQRALVLHEEVVERHNETLGLYAEAFKREEEAAAERDREFLAEVNAQFAHLPTQEARLEAYRAWQVKELAERKQARAEAERKHQEEQRAREAAERKLQEEQRARQAAEAETRRLRAEVARLQGRGREDVLVLEEELNDGQGVVPSMFFSPIP